VYNGLKLYFQEITTYRSSGRQKKMRLIPKYNASSFFGKTKQSKKLLVNFLGLNLTVGA
jgi:hypothetical protein